MGRQVRMVPPSWRHPKDGRGHYIPLMQGPYSERLAEWDEGAAAWERGEVKNYAADEGEPKWKAKPESAAKCASYAEWAGDRPVKDEYMPEFDPGTATMLMMYEDTSEGTPISPAFDTPEKLARWLADNGASAFGGMKATYQQWLATCNAGWSVGMVMEVGSDGRGRMMSGVEFSETR